ncbi:MAG: LytTR family DNA-binding domain-containing protein [Lachnospiraceae bacterium]|nr:LytTR family DNA-binding domain-containing protein [Lachnospiraceae bacterium]
MYHIAICEDEDAFICELKENLLRYAAETKKEFCFFIYHDGSELLQKYNLEYDLIFMDIKMGQMNGLKTAEEIRKIDSTVGLIFLTSWKQYVWKGYEYSAVNYLLKPVQYGVLKMELDRFFAHYHGQDEPYIGFSNDNGKYKVLYKNLCYAETDKRNVMLHFEGQKQIIYKNMKQVSSLLCAQPGFAQCHQSFVVNLSFVKSVEGLELLMITGERIPISQPKRKAFMKQLAEYIGGRL